MVVVVRMEYAQHLNNVLVKVGGQTRVGIPSAIFQFVPNNVPMVVRALVLTCAPVQHNGMVVGVHWPGAQV
jgi:hypothetical protein